jgi:integrase
MKKIGRFIDWDRAVCQPSEFSKLLRALDGYQGSRVLLAALKLAPLVFVRSEELCRAEWKHIDWDACEWSFVIPKAHCREHIVPLASQAIRVLRDLHELTGIGRYIFPRHGKADMHIGTNALSVALRRVGYSKGKWAFYEFRAAARRILEEVLHEPPEIIELQLGHMLRAPYDTAYNRTAIIADRRDMMQKWADYLDRLKGGVS